MKRWRLRREMTAKQVCESAGLSSPTLRRLENYDEASRSTFERVARALGVTERQLLCGAACLFRAAQKEYA